MNYFIKLIKYHQICNKEITPRVLMGLKMGSALEAPIRMVQ